MHLMELITLSIVKLFPILVGDLSFVDLSLPRTRALSDSDVSFGTLYAPGGFPFGNKSFEIIFHV